MHGLKARVGVCSGWLTRNLQKHGHLSVRTEGNNWKWWPASDTKESTSMELRVFCRPSAGFILPRVELTTQVSDKRRVVIMIGPGTGVAPFVGYLQHIRAYRALHSEVKGDHQVQPLETWLYFGCRHPEKDFLYREELEQLAKEGILTRLITAFSRYNTDKDDNADSETSNKGVEQEVVYVQHRLLENGAEVFDLLTNHDGRVFVCGDAKGMAKGVMAAMQQIIETHQPTLPIEGGEGPTKKTNLFAEWMKCGKFTIEAWA